MKTIARKLAVSSWFVLSLSILIPLSDSTAVSWSDETRLTTYASWDVGPSITQMQDGTVWVVWQREYGDWPSTNWDLCYKTSSDYGVSWSIDTRLTTDPSHDTAPSVCQAAGGTLFVAWASDRTGNYDIFYKTSSDGGASWSGEFRVTYDPNNDVVPDIIEDKNGIIWVVWSRKMANGYYDVFWKTSSDGGVLWSDEEQLTTDPDHDKQPSITQMWDERMWTAWTSFRTGDYEIFYKTHNGSAWSDSKRLTLSENIDMDPSITQARDGSIWVIWSSREAKDNPSTNDDLFYRVSTDNGETWSDTAQITTDAKDDLWPSTAQIDDKKLWVVWTSDRNDNHDLYYAVSSDIVIHDVAIADVTAFPTEIYRGEDTSIYVVAENHGETSETFNVTCFADSTPIGVQTVTLTSGSSTVLEFVWDAIGFVRGDYVASATAGAVPEETLPSQDDNTSADGAVHVKIPGDIDDNGVVNVIDLATVGRSYSTTPGDDLWNPNADLNHDDIVDIADLAIVANNYGKTS